MTTVYDMAKQYYPRLWDKSRLKALVEAERLTAEEYETITGKPCEENEQSAVDR